MDLKINRNLLPIKLHYFLLNGAMSGVIPMLPVYARELGISAMSVGVIYTVQKLLVLLGDVTFGIIADRFKNYKLLLTIFLGVIVLAVIGLRFIPRPENNFQEFLCQNYGTADGITLRLEKCTSSSSNCRFNCIPHKAFAKAPLSIDKNSLYEKIKHNEMAYIEENFTIVFLRGDCGTVTGNYSCTTNCTTNSVEPCVESEGQTPLTMQFWLFTVLVISAWVSFTVSTTLSDAACYNMLQNKIQYFGKQRMFGSVGWGLCAALAGYLNDLFSDKSNHIYNYFPGFYTLAVILILDMFVVVRLDLQRVRVSKNIFKDVGPLLIKPRILFFLTGVFLNGAFIGFNWSYLFWHLRSLDANQLLLGLTTAVQCCVEIPFFMLSGLIISKIGHLHTVSLASLAFAIRFMGYSYLSNPWWTLPLEIFQGPGFAAFYSAITSYATMVAPEGTEGTMQGLVGGTFGGLGVAVGNLMGGVGFSVSDGKTTFFFASIIAAVSGLMHMAMHKTLDVLETRKKFQIEIAHDSNIQNANTTL